MYNYFVTKYYISMEENMTKEFKKVLCLEVGSILCTGTLNMISMGVSPFQKLGIILNCSNQITRKGTYVIWGVFAASIFLAIKALFTERKRVLNELKNVCTKERKRNVRIYSVNKKCELGI